MYVLTLAIFMLASRCVAVRMMRGLRERGCRLEASSQMVQSIVHTSVDMLDQLAPLIPSSFVGAQSLRPHNN